MVRAAVLVTAWSLVWNIPMNNFHALTASWAITEQAKMTEGTNSCGRSCELFYLHSPLCSGWWSQSALSDTVFPLCMLKGSRFFNIKPGRNATSITSPVQRKQIISPSLILFNSISYPSGISRVKMPGITLSLSCRAKARVKQKAYQTDMEKGNQ